MREAFLLFTAVLDLLPWPMTDDNIILHVVRGFNPVFPRELSIAALNMIRHGILEDTFNNYVDNVFVACGLFCLSNLSHELVTPYVIFVSSKPLALVGAR